MYVLCINIFKFCTYIYRYSIIIYCDDNVVCDMYIPPRICYSIVIKSLRGTHTNNEKSFTNQDLTSKLQSPKSILPNT